MATGLMKDANLRRTADSVRDAADLVVKGGARVWGRGCPENPCVLASISELVRQRYLSVSFAV